jgi:hypothetical protein
MDFDKDRFEHGWWWVLKPLVIPHKVAMPIEGVEGEGNDEDLALFFER